MHIGILSFRGLKRRFMWEEGRLVAEAEKRGHKATKMRYQRCTMTFDGHGELNLRYGNRKFPKIDLMIPRCSLLSDVQIKAAVVEQMQLMGIPLLNRFETIIRAKSKLQTLQTLSFYGIPVVKTVVLNEDDYLKTAVKHIGEFPMIMKTSYSSYGQGVTIVESARSMKSTYGLLSRSIGNRNTILVQEYIEESQGKDLRIFVVGGEVIACMQRIAQEGEFRSNVGQGGSGVVYSPTEEEVHLAIRAAKALELEVAGVDIIQTKNGPAIMEVNANPGFQELEEASGVNVAEKIILHAERYSEEYLPAQRPL